MSQAYAHVPKPNNTPKPAYFAHIVLYSKNLSEMTDWYCNVLGAQVVGNTKGISLLTYDDEHHRVAIIQRDGMDDKLPNSVGVAHFAYSYSSLGDLIEIHGYLKDKGILPVREINHGPTTSLYYNDPDGNAVELQTNNFDTNEALNEWFASGAFDREPIGVEISMDDLTARLEAGEPESKLKKPLQL